MTGLAYRGNGRDRPAVALPPERLAMWRAGRLRKQWRYVAVWGPELSLCAATVQVGPATQEFWAVWHPPSQRLWEHTRRRPGRVRLPPGRVVIEDGVLRVDVTVTEDPATAVEVVTPSGRTYAWTRKQAGLAASGTVRIGGEVLVVDGLALIDDSAGHHPRHTRWRWSAGTGLDSTGAVIAWNTTVGLHDTEPHTESTIWRAGRTVQVPVAHIPADLSTVTWPDDELAFQAEAVRARKDNLLVVRSSYAQPFGSFTGTLPGGITVGSAHGVMERHDAVW